MSLAQSPFFTAVSFAPPPVGLPSVNPLLNPALDELFTSVDGRLFPGIPLAYACFDQGYDTAECLAVQARDIFDRGFRL